MYRRFLVLAAVLCLLSVFLIPMVGCGGGESDQASGFEVVQLDSGRISGFQEDGIWTYLGIPYAAPPVGELRWKEPQPVAPWEDVLGCTEFSPACPQPVTEIYDVGVTSEDCLYLNVWTPAHSPDENLPVMVWIHGGSFTTGAASLDLYNGHNLAKKDVVLVSINYRLGPFGYLSHPLLSQESTQGVSGNYGLLDQMAALEWVRDNIASFGGDPHNVTAFGESAGAISIIDMMISPLAEGLFQRVISESGSFYPAYTKERDDTLEEAYKTGEEISVALGCDQAQDVLACMREITADELVEVSFADYDAHEGQRFRPVVDGWAIPGDPASLFAAGQQMDIPLLIGTNADEGGLFIYDIQMTPEEYAQYIQSMYGPYAGEVLALFPASNSEEVLESLNDIITVLGFAAGAQFTAASMQDKSSQAYLYGFTRDPDITLTKLLGVFHGLELFYVFGNFIDELEGVDDNPVDAALSQDMMDYWTNFARTGDPNGEGLPPWPDYSTETDQYQDLGEEVTTQSGWYIEARPLIYEIIGQ